MTKEGDFIPVFGSVSKTGDQGCFSQEGDVVSAMSTQKITDKELTDPLVKYYQDIFTGMDDLARSTWFMVMDETEILSFDLGPDESLLQAEKRHAVKLHAIATALSGLPCAAKEQRTIEDLQTMANAIYKRHEAQRQASAAPPMAQGTDTEEDPYEKAIRVLKAEGLL